jgi:capsular exopolysaccharide synthesis family protein
MTIPPQDASPEMGGSSQPQNPLLPRKSHSLPTTAPLVPPPNLWLDTAAEEEGMSLVGFMHSLRRRWLPASLIGFVLATIVAGLLWLLVPVTYEAVALLRVKVSSEELLKPGRSIADPREYEVYKQTQAQLLTSPFVLNAALRELDTQNLTTIKREEYPLAWLQQELRADYPGKSEMLRLAIKGDIKDDAIKIVDEVLRAYLLEIGQQDRSDRMVRLDVLRKTYRDNVNQIRELSDKLHKLSEEIGTSDSAAAQAAQDLQRSRIRQIQDRRASLIDKWEELQSELIVLRQATQNSSVTPSEYDIAAALERDERYREAKEALDTFNQQLMAMAGTLKPNSPVMKSYLANRAMIEQQVALRRQQLQPLVVHQLKRELYGVDEIAQKTKETTLTTEIQLLGQRIKQTSDELQQEIEKMTELVGFSSEFVTLKGQLEELQERTGEVSKEITGHEVNLAAPARITLVQPATVSDESSFWLKLIEVAAAWFGTLLVSVVGIAVWDYASQRLNSGKELEKAVGIPVIGSMPAVRTSGVSLFGHRGDRDALIADSIDSIRAALTYGQRGKETHSVVVTSAVGQEGKSTLASQLAVSLARGGRRTLLVDGDVRKPQQHAVFGMPPDRGLCDVLREQAGVEDVVQATPAENLWILPAGRCDVASFQALSGGDLANTMERLGAQFEFLVVDAGPVLTGPEALIFGQYVDAAILATRRDVSQLPKVDEAYRRLQSVGVRVIGAVVNGGTAELRLNSPALAAS